MSIKHHMCNSHEWACGRCLHDPMQLPGEGREWLSAESPAAEVLREIIFDGRWLKSLQYYVRNRHTGGLEVIIIHLCIYFKLILVVFF